MDAYCIDICPSIYKQLDKTEMFFARCNNQKCIIVVVAQANIRHITQDLPKQRNAVRMNCLEGTAQHRIKRRSTYGRSPGYKPISRFVTGSISPANCSP